MGRWLSRHATTIGVAWVVAAVTAAAPSVAASFDADNAHKVDGFHAVGAGATPTQRANKLVATNAAGRLPNNIIAKAPDSERLDGADSAAFVRQTQHTKAAHDALNIDADTLDGKNSSAFAATNHAHLLSAHQNEPCTVGGEDGMISISTDGETGAITLTCVPIPPTSTTIQQVKNGSIPPGTTVTITGVVVTGLTTNQQIGWVQASDGGQYSGVKVDPANTTLMPAVGSVVSVQGQVLDPDNLAMMIANAEVVVTGEGSAPPPQVLTGANVQSSGPAWEGVLVVINNLSVTSATSSEFLATDGTTVTVDDIAYDWPTPSLGTQFASITGVLQEHFGAFKLEPRSAADMVLAPG